MAVNLQDLTDFINGERRSPRQNRYVSPVIQETDENVDAETEEEDTAVPYNYSSSYRYASMRTPLSGLVEDTKTDVVVEIDGETFPVSSIVLRATEDWTLDNTPAIFVIKVDKNA